MALWHLAVGQRAHEQAEGVCGRSGLRTAARLDGDVRLTTYRKRAVENENCLELPGGDWICCAGTLLWNGRVEREALQAAYDAFCTRGAEGVRDEALGHYAVAVRRGDRVTCFVDPLGTYDLYYAGGSSWVVSTALHVVAACTPGATLDDHAVLLESLQGRCPTEATLYDGCLRLRGCDTLEVDLPAGDLRCMRGAYRTRAIDASGEDLVRAYADEVRSVFEAIGEGWRIGLNLTGGMDTRTVLAGLLAVGRAPSLQYGVGNSNLTNTKPGDLEVAREMSAFLDIPLHQMDWSGRHPHSDEQLERDFFRHGFDYWVYGSPDALVAELEGGIDPYPDVQVGGYCPAFENRRTWDMEDRRYSLDELVAYYENPFTTSDEFRPDGYPAYVRRIVTEALREAPFGFDVERGFDLTEYVQARSWLALKPESVNLNFFSGFSHYFAPFLTERLLMPLLSMAPEERRGDRFQIRLIQALAPEVLDVSVFSGRARAVIDKQEGILSRPPEAATPKAPPPSASRRALRAVLERMPAGVRYAYYRARVGERVDDSVDGRIRRSSADYVRSHPTLSKYFRGYAQARVYALNRVHRIARGADALRG